MMEKNKLGITTDRVKTNSYADLGSLTRPLTTNERDIIQNQVERILRYLYYKCFLKEET